MKTFKCALVSQCFALGTIILAVACSSTSTAPAGDGDSGASGSDGGTAQGDTGGGLAPLTCPQVTWCTSGYSPKSASPANPPPLNGGTIPDGFYRSEEGGDTYGYLFQGSQVLEIFPGISNTLGNYAVAGASLTITQVTECFASSPDKTPTGGPYAYTFAVQGSDLFLMSPSSFGNSKIRRFTLIKNPADVCTEDADFTCSGTCSCGLSIGKTLKGC